MEKTYKAQTYYFYYGEDDYLRINLTAINELNDSTTLRIVPHPCIKKISLYHLINDIIEVYKTHYQNNSKYCQLNDRLAEIDNVFFPEFLVEVLDNVPNNTFIGMLNLIFRYEVLHIISNEDGVLRFNLIDVPETNQEDNIFVRLYDLMIFAVGAGLKIAEIRNSNK